MWDVLVDLTVDALNFTELIFFFQINQPKSKSLSNVAANNSTDYKVYDLLLSLHFSSLRTTGITALKRVLHNYVTV